MMQSPFVKFYLWSLEIIWWIYNNKFVLFISFIQCCVYSKILSYSTAWSVFGSLFSKHIFWVYGERNEKKKIAVYAICQVTDVPKDTPIKCMINWFSSNHSNPKMWKSKLKIQGEVVTRIGRKLTEKVLTLKQLGGGKLTTFLPVVFPKMFLLERD